MKKISYASIIILILACLYSCKDSGTNSPVSLDTAITYTDETGRYLGGETNDWCGGCDGLGGEPICYTMYAAYPNPVDDRFKINFATPDTAKVQIYFLNSSDTVFIVNETLQSGFYSVDINSDTLGLHNTHRRFYMKSGSFTCNGNVRFN